MKNNVLLIGGILTILNTIIGLVFSSYSNFNMIFADISILSSTAIIYYVLQSQLVDGFKIGLTFFFCLLGLAKFLCAIFSIDQLENNFALIIFICLLGGEIITYFVAEKLSSK